MKITRASGRARVGPAKRRWAVAGVSIILASGLAACGSSSPSNSGGSSGSSGSGGGSGKTIVIGFPADLTGAGAAFSVPEANAANMVINAINASGGIKELGGAKLKLDVMDDQTNPTVAAQDIRQMAQAHDVALIGPVLSPVMDPNVPLVESLKIPDFVVSGDTAVTAHNTDGDIFRTSSLTSDAAQQTLVYVQHLIQSGELKGVHSVGVVATSTPPGSSVSPVLIAGLKKMGLSVTAISYDPTTTTDYAPIVAKLKAANVDMIMGFQDPEDGIGFTKAMAAQSWRPKDGFFFSGGGTFLDVYKKAVGSAANGWVDAAFASNIDSSTYTPQSQAIAKQFLAKYGISMEGSSATLAATNIALIADALAKAKSTDPAKVIAAARALSFSNPKGSEYPYYMTPGGVKFDSQQNNSAIVIPFTQWTNGTAFTTVWPQNVATAKLGPLN